MTAGHYLFGFDGRINRAKWWLLILIQIGASIVFYAIAFAWAGASIFSAIGAGSALEAITRAGGSAMLLILLWLVYEVVMFIIWLAVTVKRLHDRDKSAAWLWVFVVAPWVCGPIAMGAFAANARGMGDGFAIADVVLSIWAFVELGCLRGTVGPNRFGPDPLAHLQFTAVQPPPQSA